jgi:anti-sigma B factor antagonist
MWVLVGEKFACVRISGRANFSSSLDFKALINELRQLGYRYFVLDLSECLLMDSTFLGVLAGFGLKMGPPPNEAGDRAIELLNPNARITELLENLGVLHLFRIAEGPLELPAETEARTHTPINPSKEELTRACIEAHQTLMEVNPQNVSRFKDVTQFMAEDLKRLKSPPP